MADWLNPSPRFGEPVAAADTAPTQAQRDAHSLIMSTLRQYGLPDSLADWAWSEIVAGKGSAEIMLDLRQRPEFKAEFPEIEARQQAKLAPLSPGDIVSYRQTARQLLRTAGLPEGFYDSKDDFTSLLVKDVSLSELNERVQQARDATFGIPEAAKRRLAEQYGVSPGSGLLTAFFLDPDRALPLITRDVNAAKIGGRADMAGYGGITAEVARGLADSGVSEDQAIQGFGDLAAQSELFESLDRTEDRIDTETQLGATFNNNAAMKRRIDERKRKRLATFQGGGRFAEGQGGVTGLRAVDG